MSIDATYSINKNITVYSQFGMLLGEINNINYTIEDKELGWGLVPIGASMQLGLLKLQAEYRIGSRRFLFNYWDKLYDLNRVTVSTDMIITRESQLYKYGKLNGFFINANMSMMNLFNFGIGYQNMQGEVWNDGAYQTGKSNQTFLSAVNINPSLIPKIGKAEAFYQQSNVPSPQAFEPNASTIWGYNVGIEVSSGVMLVYQARTTYISDLNNQDEFLPVKSLQIETQFVF